MKKFPDFVPPTKVSYALTGSLATLHLRRCTLEGVDDPSVSYTFDKEEILIGSTDTNDVILGDDTVSRSHCRIVQEDSGYVLKDNNSTNGTFVNKVRVREAFLKPGCIIGVGQSQLRFNAHEEEVQIVPSHSNRCANLIGGNAKMREIYSIIEKIAPTATTVVIDGETGTGKEVVAQAIHSLSPRAKGELVVFDCGAVPPNLIESELFGHEKGSFTGAVMSREGLFEMADGGTLFLDELGELPIDLQPKLLRALEQREVRRVGGAKWEKGDVRIIAATNRNLEDEVKAGRFRQDLFYRLSVVRLHLPSLHDRADDIPLLVQHFLDTGFYNKGPNGQPRVRSVSREALVALQNYPWPGNVRELVNVIERAVSFCDRGTIELESLPDYIRSAKAQPVPANVIRRAQSVPPAASLAAQPPPTPEELLAVGITFKDAKERWVTTFERDYILQMLRRNNGNISHAARHADIDRKYFRKLMKKYDIASAAGDDEPEE